MPLGRLLLVPATACLPPSCSNLLVCHCRLAPPQMFDEFEGDEYYKEGVEARLEGGAACPTTVYIWQDSLRSYLYGEWDPQEFRERELERYVEMCAGFAADVQQQRRWKGEFQPSSSSEEEQQQQQQREAPGGGPPGGEA